jgi:hypothetical protein
MMLRDPQAMYPGQRNMQRYDFTEDQIDDLVAFLEWVDGMDLNGFPPAPHAHSIAAPSALLDASGRAHDARRKWSVSSASRATPSTAAAVRWTRARRRRRTLRRRLPRTLAARSRSGSGKPGMPRCRGASRACRDESDATRGGPREICSGRCSRPRRRRLKEVSSEVRIATRRLLVFFATCMLLFVLQIVYGFIMGFAHAGMDGLHDVIPFHAARATHTNLLVMWLLAGFMGAAYYIMPDEVQSRADVAEARLCAAYRARRRGRDGHHRLPLQLVGGPQVPRDPRPLDYLVVVDVLLFIANIGMTIWKAAHRPRPRSVLFFGLLMAALLYLPGMIPTDSQTDRLVLALVGRPSLGGGRVGAHHGRILSVPADQAHGH